MSPAQYRSALQHLGLKPDEGADASAAFLRVDATTVRRRLRGAIAVPASEAMLLTVMIEHNMTTNYVHELMRRRDLGAVLDDKVAR